MTTKAELSGWFDAGVALNATHMIVVVDEFDHEDYPVYVRQDQDARELYHDYDQHKPMQRVMDVYDLTMDKGRQLAEVRAFHLESDGTEPDR